MVVLPPTYQYNVGYSRLFLPVILSYYTIAYSQHTIFTCWQISEHNTRLFLPNPTQFQPPNWSYHVGVCSDCLLNVQPFPACRTRSPSDRHTSVQKIVHTVGLVRSMLHRNAISPDAAVPAWSMTSYMITVRQFHDRFNDWFELGVSRTVLVVGYMYRHVPDVWLLQTDEQVKIVWNKNVDRLIDWLIDQSIN